MAGILLQREGVIVNSNIQSQSGRVTVPGKPGDDLALGTLNSILNQAKLKEVTHALRNRCRKSGK